MKCYVKTNSCKTFKKHQSNLKHYHLTLLQDHMTSLYSTTFQLLRYQHHAVQHSSWPVRGQKYKLPISVNFVSSRATQQISSCITTSNYYGHCSSPHEPSYYHLFQTHSPYFALSLLSSFCKFFSFPSNKTSLTLKVGVIQNLLKKLLFISITHFTYVLYLLQGLFSKFLLSLMLNFI